MKPIVKKYEDLEEGWKDVMLSYARAGCSFAKLYTSVWLTRRYHEKLLENEDYRDHYEYCKDIVFEAWVKKGEELITDRNAGHGTYSLIMRNMFKWEKSDSKKDETPAQPAVSTSDDDELEKFKTKKTPASSTELKVINQ